MFKARLQFVTVVLAMLAACTVHAAQILDEVPFKEGEPPPPAKPGEAWCLVTLPPTYKTVTEQVTIRPATFYLETIPAKYETREERIMVLPESKRAVVVPAQYRTEQVRQLVKEASTTYEIIPAQYEWVEEQVTVKPDTEEIVPTEATFRTVTEQVLVSPARRYWKKVNCEGKVDRRETENECYCLCEAPARYITMTKQVIDKEAGTTKIVHKGSTKPVKVRKLVKDSEVKKIETPAEYAMLERQVLEKPAAVTFNAIPAKYETIQKQILVTPEADKRVEIPAKFETMSKKMLDQGSRMVWRKIKCDCEEIVKRYKEIPGTDIQSLMLTK